MKRILFLPVLAALLIIISCEDDNPAGTDNDIPEACFEVTPVKGKVGDEIQFTNCSDNATHFVWSFGDDESSTQREPVHVYQKNGVYDIKLLAGNDRNADGVLNNDDDPDSTVVEIEIDPNHLSAELIILSADSWSPENPELSVAPDATIQLYKDQASFDSGTPDYTFNSDENGKIVFYDSDVVAEYFIVEKNGESNIVNGHLIEGVFQSQADIDNSAYQDGAVIGGLKYADINADGIINEDDQTPYDFISISLEETFSKDVVIGN